MTCVLASPWNPLSTSLSWSSMNPNPSDSLHSGLERSQSHGYASSGSEQPKKSGSTKKRASRAGTRSVSTLSAAQLERKRANDREAQRAIRQRTKDHIDGLENTISELRRSQEASDRDALAARQRNRELEEENAFMRMKLSEAGLSADLPTQTSRPQDPSLLAPHASSAVQASGANIQRPASTSTSRSFSGTHPGASGSWHQQQQNLHRGSYAGLTTLPLAVPVSASVPSQGLTTWRSHESTQSVSSLPGDVHTPARNASSLPYSTPSHAERSQWPTTTPQYQYTVTEQQHHPQYQPQSQVAPAHAPSQQHSPYGPAPMQSYPPAQHPPQQQAGYHASQMPPQSEFQNLSVSTSPGTYPVAAPGTQSFVPQQQYHVAPMQSTEYQQTHAPVPQQAISAPPYQQPSGEQGYAPPPPAHQQHQSAVHFRDETGRGYSMSHYPSA